MTSVERGELERASSERSEALPDGTTLLGDQFTIIHRMSNGGFGITYLARDNYLDRDVVIKECFPEVFCHREGTSVLVRSQSNQDKYRSIVEMFMREARSIAKMRHPNIVGVHRVFEDNDTAYMALDLIEGHDMRRIIKSDHRALTPDQIRSVLIKLLDAIDMVHQRDLLHRDISPDNILLDKWGNPVLIDFGAAREEASRETRALSALLVVKDGYSPQEFYFAGGKQTPCSDLYALGATFYHLVSGEAPPNSQTRMAEVAGDGMDPCIPLSGRFDEFDPIFLAAIDRAMSVLPKDRLQSAREWLDIITADNGASPLVLKNKPSRSPAVNIGPELSKLVSETNEYVLNSEPRENKPKEVAKKAEPAAVPEWIKEFNEETSEIVTKRPKRADVAPTPRNEDIGSYDEPLEGHQTLFTRLKSKVRLRIDKIRATWIVAVFSFSVLQSENVIVLAESLLN